MCSGPPGRGALFNLNINKKLGERECKYTEWQRLQRPSVLSVEMQTDTRTMSCSIISELNLKCVYQFSLSLSLSLSTLSATTPTKYRSCCLLLLEQLAVGTLMMVTVLFASLFLVPTTVNSMTWILSLSLSLPLSPSLSFFHFSLCTLSSRQVIESLSLSMANWLICSYNLHQIDFPSEGQLSDF